MQDWEINLKERGPQKVVANLRSLSRTDDRLNDHLILTSPCDLGVIRNGGKRGAKHGPQALLAPFLAMVSPQGPSLTKKQMALELFKQKASSLVPEDFEKVQKEEVQAFTALLSPKKPLKKVLHLGGGHDHIYPLVAALKDLGPLVIINVDAHLDTRPDQLPHSGTPFRQILKESPNVNLYQIGIHNFANGEANYQGVGSMEVLPWTSAMAPSEVESILSSKIVDYKDATLILSVDCDGLDASFMPAVSAPNHNGLSAEQFHAILKVCQNFWTQSNKPAVLGLYEFNPLYDNLAQGAARFLAQVIYRFFYGVSHSHE
jgi:formiminoglutamase